MASICFCALLQLVRVKKIAATELHAPAAALIDKWRTAIGTASSADNTSGGGRATEAEPPGKRAKVSTPISFRSSISFCVSICFRGPICFRFPFSFRVSSCFRGPISFRAPVSLSSSHLLLGLYLFLGSYALSGCCSSGKNIDRTGPGHREGYRNLGCRFPEATCLGRTRSLIPF